MNRYTRKSWDTFVMGGSNAIAVRVAKKFEKKKKGYRSVFLYGNSGCGKTELSSLVKQDLLKKGQTVCMRNADQFVSELINWLQRGYPLSEFHENYKEVDVILIEDLQYFEGKSTTLEVLQKLIRSFQSMEKCIWLTADRKEAFLLLEAEGFCEKFRKVKLFDPDRGMRKRILKNFAGSKGSHIPDEVLTMLAARPDNIRTLQGMLNRAIFYQDVLGREISKELLDDIQRLANRRK